MPDPFVIPELTRGLRAFAAPASLGGLHDRFFAPLLDARRAAQQASRWASRVTAFDAERLEATMRATLRTVAAERYPKSAPDKRALAAQLEDACGEMFDSLIVLGREAKRVSDAPDDAARVAPWKGWVAVLREVYHAADRGWEQSRMLLSDDPDALQRSRRVSRSSRRGR